MGLNRTSDSDSSPRSGAGARVRSPTRSGGPHADPPGGHDHPGADRLSRVHRPGSRPFLRGEHADGCRRADAPGDLLAHGRRGNRGRPHPLPRPAGTAPAAAGIGFVRGRVRTGRRLPLALAVGADECRRISGTAGAVRRIRLRPRRCIRALQPGLCRHLGRCGRMPPSSSRWRRTRRPSWPPSARSGKASISG